MNINKNMIVAEARDWIGTRWQKQASIKGVASDCGGLVLGVAKVFNIVPHDLEFAFFDRAPDSARLESFCRAQFTEKNQHEVEPGDFVLMQFDEDIGASHVAIIGDYLYGGLSIIHAYLPSRRVVETRLDAGFKAKIVAAFELKGASK